MLLSDQTFVTPKSRRLGHVLLTRYNVRTEFSKELSYEARKSWLDERLHLFRTVCLPSVLGQQVDLHWVIAFDGNYPDMVEPVLEVIAPHPWIVPAWQQEDETASRCLQSKLVEIAKKYAYVASSRVDNDDAIALTFLRDANRYAETVLAQKPELTDFWIAFQQGAQLHEGQFYLYMHDAPHFLTRVCKVADGVQSVQEIFHSWLHSDPGRVVFTPATSGPMWLQNVHDKNAMNSVRKNALQLAPAEQVAALFGMQLGSESD